MPCSNCILTLVFQCSATSARVTNEAFHSFIFEHPVVYQEVKPIYSRPLYTNNNGNDYKHFLVLEKEEYNLVYMFTGLVINDVVTF